MSHRRAMIPGPLLAALLLGGCVAADGARTPPRPPADMRPESLTIVGSNFLDTDDNRFLDTAPVVVYVFGDTRRYAVSLAAKGHFEFQLVDRATGSTIRTWQFSSEASADALRSLPPGPGFTFVLSLLENGSDRLEQHEGDLVCIFRPLEGEPLRARASAPVQIGQILAGRSSAIR